MSESSEPLTEAEVAALARDLSPHTIAGRLIRDLRQARADLATETATRTALRTQEARVSGLLADAGAPVGDLVTGVAALVAERDKWRTATEEEAYGRGRAEGQGLTRRSERDVLLAEVDRLRGIAAKACLLSARAEHDLALREIAGVPESEEAAR